MRPGVTPFADFLTDPQLQSIGQVAVESAWLEREVEFYIQRLARLTRKKTDAFLEGRMMSSKLELLKMLGRSNLPDAKTRDEFSVLIGRASEANTERNTVIHGVWMPAKRTKNELANVVNNVIARKRTSPGNYKTMTAMQLHTVSRKIAAVFWELGIFAERHWPTAKQKRAAKLLADSRPRGRTQPTPQESHPRS